MRFVIIVVVQHLVTSVLNSIS